MRREREEWEVYKVEPTKLPNDLGGYEERWFITKDDLPIYEVNAFIDENSFKKVATGKKYAFSLVKFLNYLTIINTPYTEATNATVKKFLLWQIYGHEHSLTIKSTGSQVSYSTLLGDVSAIKGFYRYLITEEADVSIEHYSSKKKVNKNSFYYGQIYKTDFIEIIDKHIENLKASKEYIKWYSDEEIESILSNLKTLRDKAIFLIQLEGLRIDEALSVRLSDYDQFERLIQPSRSKGLMDVDEDDTENTLRVIALDERTAEILDNYILTERTSAENESCKFSDWLFINLRTGERQGDVLTQGNYRNILKRASERTGLDPKKIRTHSGRSTKANQLLEHQIKYPEDNINDVVIKEIMGWKDINSINHYKNNNNKTIAKEVAKKIHRRKKENEHEKT